MIGYILLGAFIWFGTLRALGFDAPWRLVLAPIAIHFALILAVAGLSIFASLLPFIVS